jgi:hypothetical protein
MIGIKAQFVGVILGGFQHGKKSTKLILNLCKELRRSQAGPVKRAGKRTNGCDVICMAQYTILATQHLYGLCLTLTYIDVSCRMEITLKYCAALRIGGARIDSLCW